jgi:ribose transport system permease protein
MSNTTSTKKIFNSLGTFIALVAIWGLFFGFGNRAIGSAEGIESIVQQTVVIGIAAIGMTFIIISAGIDLSIGSAIALCSVVGAKLAVVGAKPIITVSVTLISGLLIGLFIGLLVVRAKLIPFITTLGTLLILRGLALALANSQPINAQDANWLRFWLNSLPDDMKFLIIPPGGWLMIALALIATGVLRFTVFGRHVFAVGSNENTARLCGVAVDRTKIFVYMIGGAFAALSGLMLVSGQGQGDPTGANGYELDIIAAVVIGGASLSGGIGSIFGSLIGALIITVIRIGCNLNGISESTTRIITGAIIVTAVAIDRLRQRSN